MDDVTRDYTDATDMQNSECAKWALASWGLHWVKVKAN